MTSPLRDDRPNCGRCGRFVAKSDRVAKWQSEPGEYGTVLSTWPVTCQHCTPERLTIDERDMIGHGWTNGR